MTAPSDGGLRRKDLAYRAVPHMSQSQFSDGVFGFCPISDAEREEVLRFELMVERGLCETATSIRKVSAA